MRLRRLLNRRRLTFSESDEYPHAWTTDSRTIVFESNRAGHFDLYRQDIDRRNRSRSSSLRWISHGAVVARRESLLYHESRDGKSWKVMRIPLRGLTRAGASGRELNEEFRCGLQAGRVRTRTVEGDQFVFSRVAPAAW